MMTSWAPTPAILSVDPLAPLVQVPLDLQGGELVGDDPDPPLPGPLGRVPRSR